MNNYKDMISKYTKMAEENPKVIKNIKFLRKSFNLVNFFFDAFVFMALWNWFLVPVGVPRISYVLAFGISILVAYFNSDLVYGTTILEFENHNELQHEVHLLIMSMLKLTTLFLLLIMGLIVSFLV